MSSPRLYRAAAVGFVASASCGALWFLLRDDGAESALSVLVLPTAVVVALTIRRATTQRTIRAGVLAACLTYLAAAFAYVPTLAAELERQVVEANGGDPSGAKPKGLAYTAALPLSCVAPAFLAVESPEEDGLPFALTLLGSGLAGVLAAWRRREPKVDSPT